MRFPSQKAAFQGTSCVASILVRYSIALGSAAVALFLSLLLRPWTQGSLFVLYLAAVAISTWYGGLGPGLFASGLIALVSTYLFLPPFFSFAITHLDDLLHVSLFLVVALLVSVLNAKLRAAREAAEAARQQLATALERERRVVRTLSEAFLVEPPRLAGFQVATLYHPASEAERIGGDYFDFFPVNEQRVGIVIGDVCGKGLTAALYTAATRYMLRAYAREEPEPRRVLCRLNRALCEEMIDTERFVTLVYGLLDVPSARFTFAVAGHPPPVLYDPGACCCRRLPVTGGVVGAFPEMRFEQESVVLKPGAVLVFFTDGITEAARGAARLEEERLFVAVAQHASGELHRLTRAIFSLAEELAAGEPRDDIAVVAIRRTPSAPA